MTNNWILINCLTDFVFVFYLSFDFDDAKLIKEKSVSLRKMENEVRKTDFFLKYRLSGQYRLITKKTFVIPKRIGAIVKFYFCIVTSFFNKEKE